MLQQFEEAGGVCAVHLGVMELERYGERGFKPPFPISAPDYEGVVVDAAIHADGAVDVAFRQCRGADDHAVGDVVVLACRSGLPCEIQVVVVEGAQAAGIWDVA